jgi:hypothetical protein
MGKAWKRYRLLQLQAAAAVEVAPVIEEIKAPVPRPPPAVPAVPKTTVEVPAPPAPAATKTTTTKKTVKKVLPNASKTN